MDFGKDNYAGVTWSGVPAEDGRRLFMGWMSNWQYAQAVPSEEWRSAMTLPRELLLESSEAGYRLISRPIAETSLLRGKQVQLTPGMIQGEQAIKTGEGWENALYEIDLIFEIDPNARIEFGFILKSEAGQTVVAGINPASQQVFIDRSNSGNSSFSDQFTGMHSAPIQISTDSRFRLHAFLDLSSMELFLDEGSVVLTELFFPKTPFKQIILYANKGSVELKKGTLHELKGAW